MLDAYIWNEKEHSLSAVETVYETHDFGPNEKGENEWEDFVTIFPSSNPKPLFTLTAEEAVIVYTALDNLLFDINLSRSISEEFRVNAKHQIPQILTRIKQWKDDFDNSK